MVDTLDLQDEIGSLGATNVEVPKPPPEYSPQVFPEKNSEKNSEKNIIIDNSKIPKMDSTPINDIMDPPQAEMMPPQQAVPQMMAPQQMAPQQAPLSVPLKSKNPFNLTDEQMDAVVAAVSAIAAFSDPVQERLGSFVPNFAGDNGRSMTGMLVTGLVVALMYFFARRYVIKA